MASSWGVSWGSSWGSSWGGGAIPTGIQFDYIFQFDNEFAARTNAITGPYFNSTNANMLLDLWVYDLAITGKTLPGWWCLITQPTYITGLAGSPNLKLLFSYPGPTLVTNNLDPLIGEHFTIVAGQFGLQYINNWAQRGSFHT